jgi:hypothetical protein
METPPSNFDLNILPPHSADKFFVHVKSAFLDEDQTSKFTMQVLTVLLDLANKSIILIVEHAGIEGFLKIIEAVASHDLHVTLNMLNGQTGGSLDALPLQLRCGKHQFVLDHTSKDVARHMLSFQIL